ncbi:hypothetical protein ACOMHN_047752 [Nucella lapillus]
MSTMRKKRKEKLLGGLEWERFEGLSSGVPCRSGVRAKPGRLSKESRTGPGWKQSRQKAPCRAVAGSHL